MLNRLCILLSLILLAASVRAQETTDSIIPFSNESSWKKSFMKEDWERVAVTLGIRIGLKIAVVDVLKHSVHEWRPDGSDDHSFPSRHATWAYGIAGKITYTLGSYSPWWALGSQAVADAVGMQRVLARRHYPHDVLAGAAIGVGTDLVSKVIGNWIYGRKDNFPDWHSCININAPALYVSTGAVFPLRRTLGGYRLEMGLSSALRGMLPTSEDWAAFGQCEMAAITVKEKGVCLKPLTSISAIAGMAYYKNIDNGPWAFSARIGGGYRYNLGNDSLPVNSGSLEMQAGVECSVNVTKHLAFALDGSYQLSRLQLGIEKKSLGNIGITFLTRANF